MRKPRVTVHHFPVYISNWRDSETRMRLSASERGVFWELIFFCYKEGSLPDDVPLLARICDLPIDVFEAAWPNVSKSFFLKAGRWHNRKVDEELPEIERRYEQKRKAGEASAQRRRSERSTDVEQPLNERSNGRSTSGGTITREREVAEAVSQAEAEVIPPTPQRGAALTVVVDSQFSPATVLAECADLYRRAGVPIPEKHMQIALQKLISLEPSKLPRVSNYIRWALATGRWPNPSKTKAFLGMLTDGDWDVDITQRTLPTVNTNKTKTDAAQDEATRNFLRKRGAL